MDQQQGENIASDCFRDKNLSPVNFGARKNNFHQFTKCGIVYSVYSACISLGTICTSNKGGTLPETALDIRIYLFIVYVHN